MNYLFTFNQVIDTRILLEFEMFCYELDVITIVESANAQDEAQFPPNYIVVYADTEDEELLSSISNKYNRLVAECEFVDKPNDFQLGVIQ